MTTLIDILDTAVRRYPDNPLLWEKTGPAYTSTSYKEFHARVQECAAGLIHLGVASGDRVALISEGRTDWVVAEMGILSAGAINVPLSVKLQEGNDLRFRLDHAGCTIVIVSGSQAQKIRQIRASLATVERVIVLDPLPAYEPGEYAFAGILEQGREYLRNNPGAVRERCAGVRPEDPANICYTSGTTADPKGVILTHRNYTANVGQASGLLPIPEDYCSLLILPWDHCFAHTAGIYTLMRNGASMASVQTGKTPLETLKNIPQNIKETRPTFLLSVPALAKNFRKNIEAGVHAKGSVVEWLFRTGLRAAYAYNADGWTRGRGARALLKPLVRLFDAVVFSKIRGQFGGRLEFFIGGGALLDIELQRFFYAIGIPMFQGYGLTESSPVISSNVPACHKLGSSGSLVRDLELRICDEQGNTLPAGSKGEIVVKGENVMAGYWRNPRATAETVRDGWLYTGDLGYMDEDGFLYVLGRTKSLLIANDGEKYSPEGIEEAVCSASPYIDQMMLYNNQSPFTVALVVPNKDAVLAWMREHHHDPALPGGQKAAVRLIQAEIDAHRQNGRLGGVFPDRWLPSAFALLAEPFTEQNGLLNSTLKIVRGRIAEMHAARIAGLYTAAGKESGNAENCAVIARWAGADGR